MLNLHARRGQTLPFWLVTVVILLAMLFFGTNYMTNLGWQIRAQNAADAQASALLSTRTNVLNQESVLLYSGAVAEYRLRYLDQAMLNAINGHGCTGTACATQYASLRAQYVNALTGFQSIYQLLQRANNFTQGGQFNTDTTALLKALQNGISGDPAFKLTVLDCSDCGKGKKGGNAGTVDLATCKIITPVAAGLFPSIGNWTFRAVGRAAAQSVLLPAQGAPPSAYPPGYGSGGYTVPTGFSEYVNPGTAGYQPAEGWDATAATPVGSYEQVDYSNLLVDLSWFTSGMIKPYWGSMKYPGDYQCN